MKLAEVVSMLILIRKYLRLMKSAFHKQLERYKYYEQYYNSKKDKVKALDTIGGLKEKFNKRKKTLSKEVQSEIDNLDFWLRLASEQENGSKMLIYYSHDMDLMIDKIGKKLHQVSVYFELDFLKELYGEKITSFIQDAKEKGEELFYVDLLNGVIDTGEKYLESEINFKALSEIEDKIVLEECPVPISKSTFWDGKIAKILEESQESERHPSYKGNLLPEAIKFLAHYRKKHSKLGINEFFKKAHEKKELCRIAYRKEDKKENISWSTLRDRVKKSHPDIYYGEVE